MAANMNREQTGSEPRLGGPSSPEENEDTHEHENTMQNKQTIVFICNMNSFSQFIQSPLVDAVELQLQLGKKNRRNVLYI